MSKFKNTDPWEPWNDTFRKDSFDEPWNDPINRTDPFAPWNNPFGTCEGDEEKYGYKK